MELKEFIKAVVNDTIVAVTELQDMNSPEQVSDRQPSIINPSYVKEGLCANTEGVLFSPTYIEFDLEVTASEMNNNDTSGGVNLKVFIAGKSGSKGR